MNLSGSIIAVLLSALLFTMGCTKGKLIYEEGNLVPKTVDHDPSLPIVAVNGTQLHAESFGDPDSVLIIVLHGGPGADYRSFFQTNGCLLESRKSSNRGFYIRTFDTFYHAIGI